MAQPISRDLALKEVTRRFKNAGIDSAALDARILLMAAAHLSTTDLYAWPDALLDAASYARLLSMAERRLAHEPVARILGQWEFWGLSFELSPATLVPRPETEFIIEAAITAHAHIIAARGNSPHIAPPFTFVDFGTGSGCIAISVARELPTARGIGIDLSLDAAVIAYRNAHHNGVSDRVSFLAGSWGAALVDQSVDLILSNPPYIESLDIEGLDADVRKYDPHLALDGGMDGLDAYRQIFADARRLLRNDGAIIVEFGKGQAEAIAALAQKNGLAINAHIMDLAGIERVIVATLA